MLGYLIIVDKQTLVTFTFNSRQHSKPFLNSQFSRMKIQFGIADYENCNFKGFFLIRVHWLGP